MSGAIVLCELLLECATATCLQVEGVDVRLTTWRHGARVAAFWCAILQELRAYSEVLQLRLLDRYSSMYIR